MQPAEAEQISRSRFQSDAQADVGGGEPLPRSVTEGEPFTFRCPACRKLLLLNEKFAGLEGPCPKCGMQILSADPFRKMPARLVTPAMSEPPIERRVWSPPVFARLTEKKSADTDTDTRPSKIVKGGGLVPKPLPLQKPLAKTTDLPHYDLEKDPERAARQQRMRETMSITEHLELMVDRVNRPATLSRLRITISLMTIVAVVFGILLLRSRGH